MLWNAARRTLRRVNPVDSRVRRRLHDRQCRLENHKGRQRGSEPSNGLCSWLPAYLSRAAGNGVLDSETLASEGAKSSPVDPDPKGIPTMTKRITPAPMTSAKIKHLAGEGLERPSSLSAAQVRALAGSVMAHIEPRGKAKP